jgi:hypothetical protein
MILTPMDNRDGCRRTVGRNRTQQGRSTRTPRI